MRLHSSLKCETAKLSVACTSARPSLNHDKRRVTLLKAGMVLVHAADFCILSCRDVQGSSQHICCTHNMPGMTGWQAGGIVRQQHFAGGKGLTRKACSCCCTGMTAYRSAPRRSKTATLSFVISWLSTRCPLMPALANCRSTSKPSVEGQLAAFAALAVTFGAGRA